MAIKNPPLPISPTPAWMLCFADLLSLVLTFFVLIIATAKPIVEGTIYDKSQETTISANTDESDNNIKLQLGSNADSVVYLEKVISKRFMADKDLANIQMQLDNDMLAINLSYEKFSSVAPKLAKILRVIDNDIWIYSANMDSSQKALIALKNSGLNKNAVIAQSPMQNNQILIAIY